MPIAILHADPAHGEPPLAEATLIATWNALAQVLDSIDVALTVTVLAALLAHDPHPHRPLHRDIAALAARHRSPDTCAVGTQPRLLLYTVLQRLGLRRTLVTLATILYLDLSQRYPSLDDPRVPLLHRDLINLGAALRTPSEHDAAPQSGRNPLAPLPPPHRPSSP